MGQIVSNVRGERVTEPADGALERRVFLSMIIAVALGVVVGGLFGSWRVATGLALGGGLSLLNYHWLRTSVAAILGSEKPRIRISRYIIRYLLVGAMVFAAYQVDLVSLPATIVGLCSFVPALFIEAFRQFFFSIIRREESF
jgi:hypothetical protein